MAVICDRTKHHMVKRNRTYGERGGFVHALIIAGMTGWVFAASPVQAATRHLVAFGDSLSAGYLLAQPDAFPSVLEAALRKEGQDVEVANAAVSGDTTTAGLARIDWSIPDGTDGVLLELGANDMLRGIDPKVTKQALADMIERLQARKIRILLIGMKAAPSMGRAYVDAFEAIFPDLAKKYGLPLYPFFLDGIAMQPKLNLPDGMHPTPDGVRVIVANILPSVTAFLQNAK